MGKNLHDAILDGAAKSRFPTLVSTLSICIVFVPMFLLTGVARYLFVPLAEAVVFAMLASYFFSRTLVPTLAMLSDAHAHKPVSRRRSRIRSCACIRASIAASSAARRYRMILSSLLARPRHVRRCLPRLLCVVSMG
jgi:multidrug efflux pump subunit AcrB